MSDLSSTSLTQLQTWMLSAITQPGHDGTASHPADHIAPSRQLDAARRLDIYTHAYIARLVEVLEGEYSLVKRLVGDEAFRKFVVGYLQQRPPRSYTLADLGRDFPGYLDRTRPQGADVASAEHQGDWTELVVDVARLERIQQEVYDADGPEGSGAFAPGERIELFPTVRVLAARCRIDDYATAVRKGEDSAWPEEIPTWLVIFRRDFRVRRLRIPEWQFAILQAIEQQRPLDEAMEAGFRKFPDAPSDYARALQDVFFEWGRLGFFRPMEQRL